MKYLKIYYRLFVYHSSFTVFLDILIKKEKKKHSENKKSSENDQLAGHFQSFFIYFFRPPDPKSEKNSRKSTN